MKTPRWIEYPFGQADLDRDNRREEKRSYMDEVQKEKHRRFHYLKRREEEERQNQDNQ